MANSLTAELPNCRIAELPNCRIAESQNRRIAGLLDWLRIQILPFCHSAFA
jgi:hypothetical protein